MSAGRHACKYDSVYERMLHTWLNFRIMCGPHIGADLVIRVPMHIVIVLMLTSHIFCVEGRHARFTTGLCTPHNHVDVENEQAMRDIIISSSRFQHHEADVYVSTYVHWVRMNVVFIPSKHVAVGACCVSVDRFAERQCRRSQHSR